MNYNFSQLKAIALNNRSFSNNYNFGINDINGALEAGWNGDTDKFRDLMYRAGDQYSNAMRGSGAKTLGGKLRRLGAAFKRGKILGENVGRGLKNRENYEKWQENMGMISDITKPVKISPEERAGINRKQFEKSLNK